VLARLFVLKEQRSQLKTRLPYRLALDDEMWHLAESLLPKGRAGEFNEAMMELGATVCLPRAPQCLRCPIRAFCKAFIEGNPEKYPIKTQKKQTPHKTFIAVILLDKKNRVLMGQRLMRGLLGGLWEFVCEEARTQKSEVRNQSSGVIEITLSDVRRVIRNKTGWDIDSRKARFLGNVKHAFTHFKMTKQVYVLHVDKLRQPNPNGYDQLRWVTLGEAKELALAQSEQKILAMLSG
jgi:A/G-specific adenine glycosylase